MNKQEYFKAGYISKTHGLQGEVTVVFENEFLLDEIDVLFVELNENLVPYFVEKISARNTKPFLKFENVDSLQQAANLTGRSLYLPKSIRPKLKRGQFYDDEVIGFNVEDEVRGELGVVKEIQASGPNRLLVFLHHQKEVLVPINSPFIKSVNKQKKIITLKLPDGYLDF